MSADIAPGLLRDYYGFLRWSGFDPEPWRGLLDEAQKRRDEGLRRLPGIFGFDEDPRALGAARANARRRVWPDGSPSSGASCLLWFLRPERRAWW